MGIVAISLSLGSLGEEIGRELARALSYEFADREIILKAAERFGEGERELEHLTEERPTLWERFTESTRRYLTYVQAVIWEMAAQDKAVLVGRGAPFVLRGIRHALRVRITAPAGPRAQRVEHQQGLIHEAAVDLVRQSDHERASRLRFLYHVDWDDPLLYDFVLNTERIGVPEGVRLIREALQSDRFQPTPDSLAEVRDLNFAAQAKAALAVNPVTRPLQLAVSCKNGHLSLGGTVHYEEERKTAEEIAAGISGIARIRSEILVIPKPPPAAI